MAEQDVVLRISAEIDEYKRILAKMPDVTEKEARRAASRLAQQLSKGQILAGKQAVTSAKDAAKAWGNVGESGKQAMEAIGGQVGAAAGVVEKLGRSFNELSATVGPIPAAMGAVSVGILGVTLAAVGLAKGLFAIVASAEEAVERLKEIEGTKPLPPAAIQSLKDWDQAALGLEASAARLKVVLGAELADAFSDALPVMAQFADILTSLVHLIGKVKAVADAAAPAIRVLQAVFSSGGSELIRYNFALEGMAEAGRAAAEGLRDTADGAEDLDESMRAMLVHMDKMEKQESAAAAKALAEETRKAASAAMKQAAAARDQAAAARELAAALKVQQTARTNLRGITESANADTLTEEQKIEAAFDARVKAIAELQGAAASQGAASMALDEAEARRIRDLINLDKERASQRRADNAAYIAARKAEIAAANAKAANDVATTQATNLATLASATELQGASIGLATELAQAQIDAQAEVADRAKSNIASLKAALQDQAAEQERLNESLLTDEQRIIKEEREAAEQLAKDKSGFSQAEIDATKAELKAKIRARKKNLRAARSAGKRAAKAQKQAARLGVVVNTAAAILKGFAQFGPPPSPAGVSAAAAATLAGVTQLAVIGRQKPPQFHAGGTPAAPPSPQFTSTPDEQIVSQLPGESTLNQRATQAIGTEAIDTLNRTGGGSSGGVVINQNLDGRVINRAVQRGMERGTISLGDRGGPVGIQDVYGAG